MQFRLLCARAHPLTPALRPGDQFTVTLDSTGSTVTIPATPLLLAQIAAAMTDGALVEQDALPPTAEVLALVDSRLAVARAS